MEPFLGDGRMYTHGMTFGGHPVQAAIALKNIEIMRREGILEHVRETAADFRAALEPLLELPIVGDLRGTGFFYALELVKDKETRASFTEDECDTLLRGVVSPRLFEQGLICRADDRGDPVVQISPPLVAGQEEFDKIAGTLGDGARAAASHPREPRRHRRRRRPQRPHLRGLPRARRARRLRARAPRRARRRVRDRGAVAGAARLARVVRRLDAPPEDRAGSCGCTTSATRPCRSTRATRPSGPTAEPILFSTDTARTAGDDRALLEEGRRRVSRASRRCSSEQPTSSARCSCVLRPRSGSKRPGDLLGLLREAGRAAGLARRDLHELYRVMTMPVGDLLDDWFETDALKGAIGSTGVVGVWAGPAHSRAPPTTSCTTRSAS